MTGLANTGRILADAVAAEVQRGARVTSQTDTTAFVQYGGKQTNHVLHLILSVLTVGLWLFVWPLVWLMHKLQTKAVRITVDEYGNVLRTEL